MALSSSQVRRVISAARTLSTIAPAEYVEDFIAGVLGLNPMEIADYFPQPDPEGEMAKAVAHLSREREIILRDECAIPEFAVFLDPVGGERWQIAGFNTYLASKGFDASFTNRLRHHRNIRTALRRLRQGRQLELLAAAVMNASVDYGEATKASGDQGIDAVG